MMRAALIRSMLGLVILGLVAAPSAQAQQDVPAKKKVRKPVVVEGKQPPMAEPGKAKPEVGKPAPAKSVPTKPAADAPMPEPEKPAAKEEKKAPEKPASGATGEALLTEKGLKKQLHSFSLEDEVNITKSLKELQVLQRKVFMAAKELNAAEMREAEQRHSITTMLQMRSQLRTRIGQTNNVGQQNQMILQINELGDRIIATQEDETVKNMTKEVRAKFNTVREGYVELLLDIRTRADSLNEKYEDLKIDPYVTAALDQVNKDEAKPLPIEPSSGFKTALRTLQGLEDKVLSETIKMRNDRSSSYYLSVVFDGKFTKELVIDTGSSLICLPFAMAKEIGLEPGPSAETLQMQLADGRIIEGKAVTASEVRVGKFTVENVECVVMPEGLPNASALLGMSFLKNFSYKINSDTHELVMTRIDTPVAEAKPAPKNKKKAG